MAKYEQTNHITQQYRKRILRDQETIFFIDMENSAHSVRHYAREMADFIARLPKKTEAFSALERSYRQLEKMPIRELYLGLDTVKNNVAGINFYEEKRLIMNQSDVVSFFEKQNQFNAVANQLAQEALQQCA